MILVSDRYNLVPELFEAYPEFVKDNNANIDILPMCELTPSDNFTVYIQPEPDMLFSDLVHTPRVKARPNHVFAVSGFSYDQQHNWNQSYILNFSNLTMTIRVNPDMPSVKVGSKDFAGTMLFGGASKYRTVILREIQQQGHWDNFLINYYRRSNDPHIEFNDDHELFYRTPVLNQLDDAEFMSIALDRPGWGNSCRSPETSVEGQHQWVSQRISYDLYNSAYISVVAENATMTNSFFISEKISKPLIVGQPFIVFGGANYLKTLRNLGFKTFETWIDESYDSIEDSHDRAVAVAQSAIRFSNLSDQEKQQVLIETQHIVQHNRNLALDKKWTMKSIADTIVSFSTTPSIV